MPRVFRVGFAVYTTCCNMSCHRRTRFRITEFRESCATLDMGSLVTDLNNSIVLEYHYTTVVNHVMILVLFSSKAEIHCAMISKYIYFCLLTLHSHAVMQVRASKAIQTHNLPFINVIVIINCDNQRVLTFFVSCIRLQFSS